jgi:hypothetical protein
MKNFKKNLLDIKVPKGSAFAIDTDKRYIKLHQLQVVVSARGGGKTVWITNQLRMMMEQGCLDKVILVTPTYESNKTAFEGLPVHDEIIDPNDPEAVQKIKAIVEHERDLLDEYWDAMDRYKELMKQIKSRRPIEQIDEDLLSYFGDDLEKPKHWLNGRKGIIACFIDDALGSRIYGSKSGLNNLVILHRHLGVSKHMGALGITMFFATQSYKSNCFGISPTIRNNATSIAIGRTKNIRELEGIADEVGSFCTREEFMDVYNQAMAECGCGCVSRHNILFVDTNPHPKNSHFRKNMNKMLYPKGT